MRKKKTAQMLKTGKKPSPKGRLGYNVLSAIGNTPLIDLTEVIRAQGGVKVFGKAEYMNPGGSVKDRPALYIVRDALKRGLLGPGKTILDATSGNMGIGLALVAAAYGISCKLVVPGNISAEKQKILKLLGAELIISDPLTGIDGAIKEAREIYSDNPSQYFYANQYDNPANVRAHYETTGPEIWNQTNGRITHFVAGVGTSGTLMGVGKRLRKNNPEIVLIEVQPDEPLHGIEGLKYMEKAIRPAIYKPGFADDLVRIKTEEAIKYSRLLASSGVLAGLSSGANVAAAVRVASSLKTGVVVTMLPDGASRYIDLLMAE
ncbi:MAG: cysteine synthase family protein [Halobacteria archaeon]